MGNAGGEERDVLGAGKLPINGGDAMSNSDPGPVFEVVYRSLNPWETQLMQQALRAEGIESFMDNANMVGVQWLYSNASGGVRLRVLSEDAEEARRILLPLEEKRLEETAPPCPHCGSPRTVPVRLRGIGAVLSYLLMGIPLFLHKKFRCQECGNTWLP